MTATLPPTAHPLWPAPTATAPLDTRVEVPGSKSLTNRYLVIAAIADSPSRLRSALLSRDTRLMAGALETLGVGVALGQDVTVEPGALRGHVTIDCGLAGTVMRFLPAVAALADGPVHFTGDPEALVRPMGPVIRALQALGVRVDEDGVPGHLPFTVHGHGSVRGGRVDVDASGSSQFVSGLLLAAARFEQGLVVRHTGPTLPSLPHIEMTVETLRAAGVQVDDSRPAIWEVAPGRVAGRDVRVEPDLSNAAPFLCADDEVEHVMVVRDPRVLVEQRTLVRTGEVRIESQEAVAADHLRERVHQLEEVEIRRLSERRGLEDRQEPLEQVDDDLLGRHRDQRAERRPADGDELGGVDEGHHLSAGHGEAGQDGADHDDGTEDHKHRRSLSASCEATDGPGATRARSTASLQRSTRNAPTSSERGAEHPFTFDTERKSSPSCAA